MLRRRDLLSLGLVIVLALACGPGQTTGHDAATPMSLAIEPADPTVVAVNGVAPPVVFQARATYGDGTDAIVDASFTFDSAPLGQMDPLGQFTAGGAVAGSGNVTATYLGVAATTTVTVRIEDEVIGPNVPPDGPGRFTDPTSAGPEVPTLLYPLHGAVMPTSVKTPDVQWDGGVENDLYRITVSTTLAQVVMFEMHTGPSYDFAATPPASSWAAIKNSAGTNPVYIAVDRWSSGDSQTYRSTTAVIRVVPANVTGAIYYWNLTGGHMLRITEQGRDDFMPTPPPRTSDQKRCVACHTVSRDGRYLAAELWDGGDFSAIFNLTQDLSGDPPPMVVPPSQYRALSSAFNDDGSRLLISYNNSLSLIDPLTGAAVPAFGSPLPTAGAAHPAWSPNGAQIAYVSGHNGAWAVDFTLGALSVMPVTGADTFGAPTMIVAAGGMANAWPSFSPDSNWIAFGRGVHSRGELTGVAKPGSLHIVSPSGNGMVALDQANGGALNSYLPNFSPFEEGGYFWLAFYSTRDYGNAQVGTRGTNRRQLWITAISSNPTLGQDPSSVPYWLPDQDTATDNMSAYWAPAPPVN